VLTPAQVVFLLDVDNTLLDNDRLAADLGARLEQGSGTAGRDRGERIDFDLSHFPAVAPVRAAAPTRSTSPQEEA
jgi:hypothetical protein